MSEVYTVFDGVKMQQLFLLLTKQAEETVYQQVKALDETNLTYREFLALIKEDQQLKELIQDLILHALANTPWDWFLKKTIQLRRDVEKSDQ